MTRDKTRTTPSDLIISVLREQYPAQSVLEMLFPFSDFSNDISQARVSFDPKIIVWLSTIKDHFLRLFTTVQEQFLKIHRKIGRFCSRLAQMEVQAFIYDVKLIYLRRNLDLVLAQY